MGWRTNGTLSLALLLSVALGFAAPVEEKPQHTHHPPSESEDAEHAEHSNHVSLADDLCASSRKPRIAVMACGNLRTFGDPRVYKSFRHNLVDALGANTTVFVWMRMEDDAYKVTSQEPLRPGYQRSSYDEGMQKVRAALSYIARHGKNVEVLFEHVNGTSNDIINDKCPIFDFLKNSKEAWHRRLFPSYIGQMHTHYMAFRMVEAYEQQHGMQFEYVIKTRTDLVILKSVMPFCAYNPTAVYTGKDFPSDWFLYMPRAVMQEAMRGVWDRYVACRDGVKYLKESMAECCGGGPTGLVVGAVIRMHAPLIGPPYPPRLHQGVFAAPPAGSVAMKHEHFSLAIMRDATDNFFCSGIYLYSNTQEFFPNVEACRKVLDPDFIRLAHVPDQRVVH